jgi:hypothetical protein
MLSYVLLYASFDAIARRRLTICTENDGKALIAFLFVIDGGLLI